MGKKKDTKGLTVKKEEDMSEWYTEVVQKAELADYAPVRGFMVIRPNAYSMWEGIQDWFNSVLHEKKVRNAYFPLLIPDSFFKRESQHAEGFSPELAYIEKTGEENEGDKLAIRPTSETIMYDSYSKWIRSHRDLPLLINQWCNVLRWEVKQTKPFLRTREFLWQEGHCVFADEKGAIDNMHEMVKEYKRLSEELLAIPVMVGRKSVYETFAGAKETQAIEGLMPDGKALQMGTSHNLGDGFAKVFGVNYQGEDGKENHCWQTSWGVSTRLIGAVVMVHGDDRGLVMPPRLARDKCVVVPIIFEDSKKKVMKVCDSLGKKLERFGVIVDDREEYNPGWKFSEWELKGVPLRIEVGPKDVEKKQVTVVRRDTGKKTSVAEKDVEKFVEAELEKMQKDMLNKAKKFLKSRIDSASTMSDLKKKLKEGKIVKVHMEDSIETEEALKDATGGATSRIIEKVSKKGKCVQCGKMVDTVAYVARSY